MKKLKSFKEFKINEEIFRFKTKEPKIEYKRK